MAKDLPVSQDDGAVVKSFWSKREKLSLYPSSHVKIRYFDEYLQSHCWEGRDRRIQCFLDSQSS